MSKRQEREWSKAINYLNEIKTAGLILLYLVSQNVQKAVWEDEENGFGSVMV